MITASEAWHISSLHKPPNIPLKDLEYEINREINLAAEKGHFDVYLNGYTFSQELIQLLDKFRLVYGYSIRTEAVTPIIRNYTISWSK